MSELRKCSPVTHRCPSCHAKFSEAGTCPFKMCGGVKVQPFDPGTRLDGLRDARRAVYLGPFEDPVQMTYAFEVITALIKKEMDDA